MNVATAIFSLLAIFVVTIAALALIGASQPPRVSASGYSGSSIEMCWQEYERRSLSPAEKRFIAATCEMMEGRR